MSSSSPDARALAMAVALALGGTACSTPASMFARAAAAERERDAYRYEHQTMASPATVPSWAIHVERPEVDQRATLESLEARLTRELAGEESADLFVSPEQLAALAVRELQQGHPFDAAVLLALASYRRIQQADAAHDHGLTGGLEIARERVGYRNTLNEAAYREYVEEETRAFEQARFDDEIERIAAKQGLSLDGQAVDDDLMRLVMGNINDPDAANRAIKEREAVMTAPTPEKVFHPGLASTVHHYLISRTRLQDGDRERVRSSVACRYLARVPLRAFRFSALQTVVRAFDGWVVRAGVRLYAQEPARVAELLQSVRGETRAHVAIVLGLSGDITRIRELQQRLDVETDPRVQLALAFALLRLGESQHLATLQTGLRDANPLVVEYATVLVHWLPHDLALEFSEASLSRVVASESLVVGARLLAALVLCEIGAKRRLSEGSLQLVLKVAREARDNPEQIEMFSREFARLEQLDRARVLEELRKKGALVEPWLARLAQVALPADLSLLDTLVRSRAYREQQLQVIRVTTAIPGIGAQTALQRWFADYPRLRTSIFLQLIMRSDLDKGRLRDVIKLVGGAHRFMFALASGEANPKEAAKYTSSQDAEERHVGMLALRLFGSTIYRQVLWPNASYYDDHYYPAEVRLRQLALATLIDLELNRSDRSVATQPAAEGLALEMTSELVRAPARRRLPEPPSELSLRLGAKPGPLTAAAIHAAVVRGDPLSLKSPSAARESAIEETERAPTGSLSEQQVNEVIHKNKRAVAGCYQSAVKFDAMLKGQVIMRWRVGRSGRVVMARVDAASTLRDSFLEDCLVREVMSWQFPEPAGGSEVSMSVPFGFGGGG